MVAIVPAAITVFVAGEQGTYQLLILSQVILSMQLPFAVIPLIRFTSDRARMGEFANPGWVKGAAWGSATLILSLNLWLVYNFVSGLFENSGEYYWLVAAFTLPIGGGFLGLLGYVIFQPWLPGRWRPTSRPTLVAEVPTVTVEAASYRRILVPLDHSTRDADAVRHAIGLAKPSGAALFLIHVEEGVTSQVYGAESATAEVQSGEAYLAGIAASLQAEGLSVETHIRHSADPAAEIVRLAGQVGADLVVMGAHGHKGIQDLALGTTINVVRHKLSVPVLIVRGRTRA
jgi:manganese transport protein